MPGAKGRSRSRFTPELWAKWMARSAQEDDAQTRKLREGIMDMRLHLESYSVANLDESIAAYHAARIVLKKAKP
jgi:uncharacterized small protein (DUF1192 family)